MDMEQLSLFDTEAVYDPLASRMRPEDLDEFAGQTNLLGKGKLLRQLIEQDRIPSMIFWGPPGVGKTTLAGIIAKRTHAEFVNFSAVTSGIKEIREVMAQAEGRRRMGGKTVLFVDEIHRFNKAQQDAFLPFVEKGSIILIGATTENPSFEINSALLSRCRVFVLHSLSNEELVQLIRRALTSPKGLGYLKVDISSEMIEKIAAFANGDARTALNVLEMAVANGEITGEKTIVTMDTLMQCIGKKSLLYDKKGEEHYNLALNVLEMAVANGEITGEKTIVTMDTLMQCIGKKSLLYDKKGEEHYNLISALHKSMRNSDPDAAVYWLARMLEAGEDPLYVARRLVRFASEDIGMADNSALPLAVAAYQACHFLGMPECNVHLSHAVIYLSTAPKSNSSYMAYEAAKEDAKEMLAEPVPLVIRNAPTDLMKELHYGDGYVYAHDTKEKIVRMQCLPDSVKNRVYYRPGIQGDEKVIKDRMERIKQWRNKGVSEH